MSKSPQTADSSAVVWEYGKISVFSHHASIFRIGKNPLASILLAQSVALSVLCPDWSLYTALLSDR